VTIVFLVINDYMKFESAVNEESDEKREDSKKDPFIISRTSMMEGTGSWGSID